MAVPNHIVKFHNTKEEMSDVVRQDTDIILEAIDLDELLADPKSYLSELGNLFMEQHSDDFAEALSLGRKHGSNMSERSKGRNV